MRAFAYELLQRKVKGLEEDNRKLRAEASQLVSDSSESELREEQLLHDVLAQLGIYYRSAGVQAGNTPAGGSIWVTRINDTSLFITIGTFLSS